jgi:hypothetical protein
MSAISGGADRAAKPGAARLLCPVPGCTWEHVEEPFEIPESLLREIEARRKEAAALVDAHAAEHGLDVDFLTAGATLN